MNKTILGILLIATAAQAGFDLQEAIDQAKPGSILEVPKGTYPQPITIKKGITLKADGAVLEITSNNPALLIDAYKPIRIEGLTIRWKTESKPQKGDTPYALFVCGGEVVLQDCTFMALGSADEAPCAVSAQDKSELEIRNCRFNGFEYTIQFWGGAQGRVEDCIVMDPGHCGITIGGGSKAELVRNIVAGSAYHGIRCTGGQIDAKSNLVLRNKNRGFYMGNKSAFGEISNNLIVDNATGINVFANSKLDIKNNVIVRSSYAGLSIIDTASVDVEDNIIVDNEKGVVGFSAEKGKDPSVRIKGGNLLFGNKVAAENADLPSKTVAENPRFKNADAGLFESATKDAGLENPEEMQALWNKWQEALDNR